MKKIIALLMVISLAVCFAACGKTGDTSGETSSEIAAETINEAERRLIINSEPFVITAKDGFDNAGVTELVCDADATYSFTANDDSASWSIYVLDEKFEDGARYLSQANEPALEGNGNLEIAEGKYIYVLCSESAFSADSASEAFLSINYAEENGSEVSDETERRLIINSEPVVITAKDGFDNAGVTELVCDADATYSFTASGNSVDWKVYVLDEKFEDGARYLSQANEPALEGDGNVEIAEGKYIYVLCSENAFTADSASDAFISINYAE